jgi:PAS domain S-box-containing protein
MEVQPVENAQEIKRLQRCMSDLVGVLALPAVWSRQDPGQIAATFCDALLAMLNLDFLYARARLDAGGPIEAMKLAPLYANAHESDEIRRVLLQEFGDAPQSWPAGTRRTLAGTELSLLSMPLGLDGEIGVVVAGSRQADFPQQTERLLLNVAANQMAMRVQQARLLNEQKRIAGELDRRVAERTRELAEANEELELQVGLLQNLPVSAWTLMPDGTPDFVNRVWLEFSGQSADFVRSHPEAWMTAVHPEDREKAARDFREGVHSGQGFAIETRSRRAQDGTYRWHLQQAVALRDAEGKVLKFVGTTTDIDDQKRAQEELRQSEGELRRVIDAIPTLSWCNHPDGPSEFLSRSWHEYTGLSPEEADGWGWQSAFHPEDLPRLAQSWRELVISGEAGEIEARLRRHDGVYRWFLMRVQPFRDSAGKILRWYGTSTDIHDRKLADEAVRASEANLRRVIDTIPSLSWCNLPDGPNEFLSKGWHDYTGLSPEEAHGWGWSTAFHPDDLPPLMKRWQELLVLGESGEIEARIRRHDGEYRWFLIRVAPFRDETGAILRWYGTSTDIHDRKLADEALRASATNLRQIVDSIPGLVFTMDATGQIQQLNRPLLEYFGKTREELKNWRMTDAVHPDDLPEVIKVFTHSIATGTPYDIEHRCRRADGVYRWLQVRALAVRGAEDNILGWYVLLTDIDDRKHAEDELKRSEAGHRVVVETANDAVISINESGVIILANPAAKRVLGYEPADLIGKPLTMLMPEAGRVLHEAGFRRYLETGQKRVNWQGVEFSVLRANGKEFPAEVSFGEMTSAGQKIFTGFIRDISEKKRAEEIIRSSEQNLSLTINTMPALAWSARPDGSVEFLSRRWLEYTGMSAAEAQGWGWVKAILPDDLDGLIAYWQSILASGEPGEIEARVRQFDGNYRWFLIRANPLRNESGAIVKWYGINTDIHDRKLAEGMVRQGEAFLAEAQQLAVVGSFSWRLPTGEINWSEQLYRIFEIEPGLPITMDLIRGRMHPEDLSVMDDLLGAVRNCAANLEYEHRLLLPDASIKHLHLVAHAHRLDDDRLEYIGAVQDVTKRQAAEAALANARSDLAKVTRITSLGVLTASIAHEVNQPLSGIVTNASTCLRMLDSNPPNIEGARETARRTIRDGNRASDVVTRLRALFSRKEVPVELIDLNEAAKEVVALSMSDLQRNRVLIRQQFGDDLSPVKGDRVQLQQVILNLVRNASDAMSTVEDRPRELRISTEKDIDNRVRLTVEDTGIGFDPKQVEKLFQPFHTSKNDGMGIGLSISRSIVEAHSGRLWGAANDGPGATFAFSIPCNSPTADAAESH